MRSKLIYSAWNCL